jgi:hypothetical protein
MQLAREAAEDAAVLLGPSDRAQGRRLTRIALRIEAEIAVLAERIETVRKAEKGQSS